MYGSLLPFLIAIVIQALAPRGGRAAWTAADALHFALYPLAVGVLLRFRFRRLMARALHEGGEGRGLRVGFSKLVESYQALLLIPFAAFVYATRYPILVIDPASRVSEVLGNVLGILPYLLTLVLLWWESYPLQGVLFGQSGSRLRFVFSHVRMEFPILAPWLVIMALLDGLRWAFPKTYAAVEANPVLQFLYAPIFLVLVGVFLPVLAKFLWGCTPVPEGEVRRRLSELGTRLRIRASDILFWPLLEGKVMNAGIFGLVPRFRYLLVTPALVDALPPDELDGVVAHEAGHIRHGHLWFLLLVFVGYMGLVAVFSRCADAVTTWWGIADPEALHRPHANLYVSLATTVSLVGILFFYFRTFFGAMSRAFERQADAFALAALGDARPLVSALERISFYSGDIRDLPSWHHGSIGERVRFLLEAAQDPGKLQEHNRSVRRMKRRFCAGLVATLALAAALHVGPVSRSLDLFVLERGLLQRIAEDPKDGRSWFSLALVYQEAGDEAKAESTYQEVIRLSPRNAEALNNLAWIYVTAKERTLYRPERALALAEMAVKISPDAHILDTLAEARFRTRDFQGAVQAIQAALAQNPSNRGYYLSQRAKFMRAFARSG